MSKFKPRPSELLELPELPRAEDVARFAAGADTRSTETPTEHTAAAAPAAVPRPRASRARPRAAPSSSAAPWDGFSKDAKPLSGINLRLNDYERELLRFLAESDQRSIQQTIKRLLVPAAEAAATERLRKDT